jgi:hypothetical protein
MTAAARGADVAGATMAGVGGLLIILGSVLPWFIAVDPVLGVSSVNGMRGGDGLLTLAFGAATLLVAVMRLVRTRTSAIVQRFSIASGIGTRFVAAANYVSIQRQATDLVARSDVGIALVGTGIWALLAGALLAVAGGVLGPHVAEP